LWRAYRACRRRKRGTANAQRYELRLLDNVLETLSALRDRTYVPSRAIAFVAKRPKAREIHAADFADRVVHHLLVPRLEALYEPLFIHDLYSNRKGKGIHGAVDRLGYFMRSLSANGQRPAYYLQLDVGNFFNSIDRPILWLLLQRRLRKAARSGRLAPLEHEQLHWLSHRLLRHDPAANVLLRGRPESFAQVPAHKRLLAAPPHKGLPIGNLTSQFFANVYLNELDQFVKHELKCRHYLRYVDDMVLLHENPDQLCRWEEEIEQFLAQRLQLSLKQRGILKPVGDGADFLGYIVRPHYRLVRRRVVGNLREKLDAFEQQHMRYGALTLSAPARQWLEAMVASYWGHFRHASHWRLTQELFDAYPWLPRLFARVPSGRLRPLWEPWEVVSLDSQWRHFHERFPDALVWMQTGRWVETSGQSLRQLLESRPGLRRWRAARFTERPRIGPVWALSYADYRQLGASLRKADDRDPGTGIGGLSWMYVAEEGYLRGGMKRRVLRYWRRAPLAGHGMARGAARCRPTGDAPAY
jgi:RNA-directed DNA polymerase